ncbi:MAG: GIY-YIG nuclease family protein [Candidatus Vogelbacteria bacterium]|nr:GIY-YIG nuclease family protein [Candidatus Vogelbacteria bacterium]
MESYFVYILKCADGTLYVGSTNNLERRLKQHNGAKTGAHYTKIRRPVSIAYREQVLNLSLALKREHEIKSLSRARKLELIRLGLSTLRQL